MNQEDPVPSDVDFARELESLLEQHDYESPKVGDIRDAVIVSLSQQGVIVDLGMKRDGIIQPSDLDKLEPEEREALAVNDEIPVYILSTDEQDSLEVSLYMARMNEDWIEAQELLESGDILESEIIGHNRGGALVSFGRLRGFVPASHLTFLQHGMNDQDRQRRLARAHGEKIPLKVIEVDRRRRRLVLSHREAEREWQSERRKELLADLKEGDVIQGRVTGWRDFGAFVDLGGADGLVHVSELAWHRVEHPREVVKMGETLDVYVLNVDRDRERISLSRKKLLPNPWTLVDDKYSVGELVEGRIIRIVDYGAFVEVEPGVEGLLHTSQISRGTVDSPAAMLAEDETHLLRIISIDADRQRMGLSLKAVTPTEQIEWMTQREHEQAEAEEEELEMAEAEATAESELDAAKEELELDEAEAPADAEPEAGAADAVQIEAEIDEAEAPTDMEPETGAADAVQIEAESAELEAEPAVSETEEGGNETEESDHPEAAEEVAVTTEVESAAE